MAIRDFFRRLTPTSRDFVAAGVIQFGFEALRDLVSDVIRKEGREAAKKVVDQYASYTYYRLTGKIPEKLMDIFSKALVRLEQMDPDAWEIISARIADPSNLPGPDPGTPFPPLCAKERAHFIIHVVQAPQDESDKEQKKAAIKETAAVLQMWGKKNPETFARDLSNLNIRMAEKDSWLQQRWGQLTAWLDSQRDEVTNIVRDAAGHTERLARSTGKLRNRMRRRRSLFS